MAEELTFGSGKHFNYTLEEKQVLAGIIKDAKQVYNRFLWNAVKV